MAKPKKATKGTKQSKKRLSAATPFVLIIPARTITVTTVLGAIEVMVPEQEVPVTLPPCPCCAVCDATPTGVWCIPYREPAGDWNALTGPTAVAVKVVKGDQNGPFLANE